MNRRLLAAKWRQLPRSFRIAVYTLTIAGGIVGGVCGSGECKPNECDEDQIDCDDKGCIDKSSIVPKIGDVITPSSDKSIPADDTVEVRVKDDLTTNLLTGGHG